MKSRVKWPKSRRSVYSLGDCDISWKGGPEIRWGLEQAWQAVTVQALGHEQYSL